MTEEEAALKRCCGPAECGHFNVAPYPARWCVGAACMAWRWVTKPVIASAGGVVVEDRGPDFDPQFMPRRVDAIEAVAGDGYCGLAGAVNARW